MSGKGLIIKENKLFFCCFLNHSGRFTLRIQPWIIFRKNFQEIYKEQILGMLRPHSIDYLINFFPFLIQIMFNAFNKTLIVKFFFKFYFWEILKSQIYELRNLIGNVFLRAKFMMGHHKSHSNFNREILGTCHILFEAIVFLFMLVFIS